MIKPDKLYHFTKTETAIRYILPKEIVGKSQLRMSNIGSMNDPKENLMFISNIEESINVPIEAYRNNFDSYVIANFIRNESYALCFTVDKVLDNKKIHGYNLQRMWAQYGDNCSGVCIVLDYESFIQANKHTIEKYNIMEGFVEYNHHNFFHIPTPLYGRSGNENRTLDSKCLCEHWEDFQKQDKFIKERFFKKNIDWEGESEYRFLAFSKENSSIFLDITRSIEKIILGLNVSKYYLPSIERLVDKEKIYQLEMGIDEQFRLKQLH